MIKNSTRNQDELSRILDTCLELIASGSGTVDSVIQQYPEHGEQLRPALEAAQWLQTRSEVFNPRPGFVQLSQRRLVNRFRNNGGRAGATSTETLSRIPAFFQERRMVVQYSALLTLTAVLLFVGFRSTAFLIQRSIPGDPLYGTKLAQEELQVSLSFSEENEARLRIEFAQRRVIEMQELILVGRDSLLDETFDNFKFQMAEAAAGILTIAKADASSAAELSSLFEETLTVPIKNLVGILDTTTEFVSVEFIDSINVLTAEIFDLPPYEALLVLATVTPTSTNTSEFTPTTAFTATFTSTIFSQAEPTSTEQASDNLPLADTPTPTNTSSSRTEPSATPTPSPTIAPTPTTAPTATVAPNPTDSPEPTPDKTKKPNPTPRPTNTHRPTSKP
ncbi:MAG: hypothetical protein IMY85_08515 [Chloroflexi bacterium]|nr:hypothetical protein [Chloroflexota bacterium]